MYNHSYPLHWYVQEASSAQKKAMTHLSDKGAKTSTI